MQRIVLVSHCIRGAIRSPERLADIAFARAALEALRKHEEYKDAVLTASYLLHADVNSDVTDSRIRNTAGYHLVPHNEVAIVSSAICGGVRAEITRALGHKLPVHWPVLEKEPLSAAS